MVERKWRSRTRPQDVRVGKHFVLSDFLYSQTAVMRGIPNCPSSWTGVEVKGLKGLCKHILDPVVEEFGAVSVTFGFCSLALWKHWYPNLVEPRALHLFRPPQGGIGGAADIVIHAYQDPRPVFNWIRVNCDFDRLILYPGSPIICCGWTEVSPRHHAKEWVINDGEKAQYLDAGWEEPAKPKHKTTEEPKFKQGTLFPESSGLPRDCSSLLLSPNADFVSLILQGKI
ncbi:MAG: hypothetical protein ICV85_07025 [Tolypothrix sp. T3-bin4]|nr:hypothetical protein [Tolypothrix sp. T3-bin4]